jgi:foldase protein PrsA
MFMQILRRSLIVSILACFALTICIQGSTQAAETQPAISVGSQTVDHSTVQQRIDKQLQRMKSRMGAKLKQNPSMEKKLEQRIKQRTVKQIVNKLTLLEHAKKANLSVNQKEIDQKVDKMKQRMKGQGSFQERLKKAGTSEDELKKKLRENLLIQKFIEKRTGEISVTDSEAKAYYQKNSKRFGNRSFEQLKPRIKKMLQRQKRGQKVQKLVSSLKKQTDITVRI